MTILIGRILKAADHQSNLGNITISFSFPLLRKVFHVRTYLEFLKGKKKKERNFKIANAKYLIFFLKYLFKKTNF